MYTKCLCTTLLLLVIAVGTACAAESIALTISCSVPAIPGVNVPPFDTPSAAASTETSPQSVAETPDVNPSQEEGIEETGTDEILLASDTTDTQPIETLYPR